MYVKIMTCGVGKSSYLYDNKIIECSSLRYDRYYKENIRFFLDSRSGYELYNYDGKGLDRAVSFVFLNIDDNEPLVVFSPCWIYVMNDNGKTFESIPLDE